MKIKQNNWKVWLIQSTLGTDDIDELPKSTCKFFWTFIFSLLMIPFGWMSHVINLITKNKDVSIGGGITMHVVGISIVAMCTQKDSFLYKYIENKYAIQKLFIAYLFSPIALTLLIISFFGIGIALMKILKFIDYLTEKRKRNTKTIKVEHVEINKNEQNWIVAYLKNVKEKHCTKIDYID